MSSFNRIALEYYVIPHFCLNLNTLISLELLFFAIEVHLGVINKMAAVGHFEFLGFDIIAVKSYVIGLPHF